MTMPKKLFNDYQPFINDQAMPTDAELLRSLRASWEERGKLLDRLLVARMVDLAAVAMLIDRSPNSDALSEFRGVILEAVEVIKCLRREMEVRS